eukprot:CAMPEP_0183431208 /NCGR_PEP_ID=MMETSP0370-20130417/54672_1 /TAXON_ID=268820 /ORGANISM="Peridinium aciculiferum, Strain PAER-2" /LENGTH=217 /DNA_ID=CAMNT_0025616841 /DNA_START=163 /DNA_END=812 /DNA_ORIENTATION=-
MAAAAALGAQILAHQLDHERARCRSGDDLVGGKGVPSYPHLGRFGHEDHELALEQHRVHLVSHHKVEAGRCADEVHHPVYDLPLRCCAQVHRAGYLPKLSLQPELQPVVAHLPNLLSRHAIRGLDGDHSAGPPLGVCPDPKVPARGHDPREVPLTLIDGIFAHGVFGLESAPGLELARQRPSAQGAQCEQSSKQQRRPDQAWREARPIPAGQRLQCP